MGSEIEGNVVTNEALGGQFVTDMGIQSAGSLLAAEESAFTAITNNTVIGASKGIVVSNIMAPTVSGNDILTGGAVSAGQGEGIKLYDSNLAQVTDNTIWERSIGISVHSTLSPTIANNVVISPTLIGIVVTDDLNATVASNEIDHNGGVGIHYASGINAELLTNEVTSLFGAGIVGIRVGSSNLSCAMAVDNLLLENNILNGGGLPVQVFCDAWGVTKIP
jgi:parallel beta-helix repeat protein